MRKLLHFASLTTEIRGNMEIKVYNNNVEKALRDFKRKLQKEGFIREIRNRRFYEKPSEKRNRKQKEAKKKKAKARRTGRFG